MIRRDVKPRFKQAVGAAGDRFSRSHCTQSPLFITGLLTLSCLVPQLNAVATTAHNQALQDQPIQNQSLLSQPHLVSQAPSLPQSQQGNQILLNGRIVSAAWAQWSAGGQRFGITEAGLSQAIGVELLNTADATRQPVQWFSDPTTAPLKLPTRLTGALRYLDITELAQRSGWQLQVKGAVLQLTSPPATVTAIRQGKQPWGDRLVIELDRSTPWQVDQQNQEVVLTLDAQIPAATLQSFKPVAGNRLKAIKIEPGNQTRIRLSLSSVLRPRVWSLPNTNRLIVDIRPDSTADRDILWAPGLRWRTQTLTVGAARFPVVWLEVDPRQPGVSLKPILPNPGSLLGTAPLLRTAQQAQVAAAINSGFFNRNNQLPLGAVRLDGRWLSGPILGRGAIAWNATGETKIARLTLQETLVTATGQRLPLTYLNSAYVQAGIARYTSGWGTSYSPFTDNEILVTVQNNQVVSQQTLGAAGSTAVSIPATGYLLAVRSNRNAATLLTVGTLLQLETAITPPDFNRYEQIIGGGPLLLQNRQIVLDAKAEQFSNAFVIEKASRSAIGQTADGKLLIATVHNDLDGSGATLTNIAQIMQQLGAVNALNLDGGSSTTLYLGGQLLDRLPRTAARVHNGIGIFLQPSR